MLSRRLARWFHGALAIERGLPLSRRAFLGGVGVGALGMAACTTTRRPARDDGPVDDRRPRVAILGAGLAGLTCLHELRKHGIDAVCYERAERVGGRVKTARDLFAEVTGAPHHIELGGEFIDSDHTELLALVNELGLTVRDLTGNPAPEDAVARERVYWADGQRVDELDLMTGFVPVAHAIIEARQRMGADDVDYRSTSAAARRYDETPLAEFLAAAGPSAAARKVLDAAYTAEYGVAAGQQSALNLIMMLSDDNLAESAGADLWALFGDSDERWQVEGGNDQVATRIAARHASRIRLGCVVEQLAEKAGGGWRIALAGGREVDAEVVVCTIPFSVLRHVPIRAELSDTKRRAIAELGYGNNAKLVLPFSTRPWERAGDDGTIYADLELQTTWAPDAWAKGAGGVLTNFVGGSRGFSITDGTTAEQARRLAADLERIWPGAAEAARVDQALRQLWLDEPGALGSYAAYLIGQWTTIAGAEPEPVGTLLFAGEHTSADFQGYMGGAVQSGVRAAKDVLALV